MTKLAIVLLGLVSVALAAPLEETSPIPILRQAFDGPNPDGSYQFSYEGANGIQAQEQGNLRAIGGENSAMTVQGSYTYIDENGEPVSLTYIADENGFQPQGAHLPTSPPIPKEILEALAYNAAHPEEDGIDGPAQ